MPWGIAVMMLAMFGTIILLPIYLTQILGFDTLGTGLLLAPGALLMGLLGPFVGRLYDKHGPTPLIVPAIIVVSVVLWAMTLLGTDTWWPYILAGHLVMIPRFGAVGAAMVTACVSAAVTFPLSAPTLSEKLLVFCR